MSEQDHETTDAHTTEGATTGQAAEDRATPAQDQGRAVAVVPKQRLIATSNVAIWDSAAFEHMGRVGAVMADSGLMNPTIYKDGPGDNAETLPRSTVIARCVMIANLAREVGANPLMLLQTASIIRGKLHLEGKAVAAIVTARTGVKLRYRFGVWDEAKARINFPEDPLDAEFFEGAGDLLAVRTFDPEDPELYVDGYVRLWKTDRAGSPWKDPANWRRQLRYRGAPEWARAYEPGAILGFYSDADEDLDPVEEGPRTRPPRAKRDLASKLQPQAGDQGFDASHVQTLGEGAKPAAEDADVVDAEFTETGGQEATQASEATDVAGEGGEADPGASGAAGGDDASDAEGLEGASAAQDALDAEEGDELVSAELQAKADALARMSPQDEEVEVIVARLLAAADNGETISEGHAEEGEQYLIAGEEPGADGRRLTYKDGGRYSGKKDVKGLRVYAIHAPLPEETETPAAEGNAPETGSPGDGASPGQDPASVPSAESPSDGSASAAGATGGSEPLDDTFLGRIGRATTWAEVKAEWTALNKTTDWMGAPEPDKDEVRRAVWANVERIRATGEAVPDHATDVTAFGIWLATMPGDLGKEGGDAAVGTLDVLKGQPIWAKLTEAQVKALEDRVAAVVKRAGRA